MTRQEIIDAKQLYIDGNIKYCRHWWQGWNYSKLKSCCFYGKKRHGKEIETFSDMIIFADTETSKEKENTTYSEKGVIKYNSVTNYIVLWTITLRVYGRNLVTLYGYKPSDFCKCLQLIINNLQGMHYYVFFHNLAYDYVFLRKFLYQAFGNPSYQLATKPHYPIIIEFDNGLIFRDSLILAQRSLFKWSMDLDVEHKKAVDTWDYDKIRLQSAPEYTDIELTYAEHDTLAGAECIEKTMQLLDKKLCELPLTATGIPREQVRKRGKENKAHEKFKYMVCDLEVQEMLESVFHGGFTHGNRHIIDYIQTGITKSFDFASSYPFCMLAFKYPVEKFRPVEGTASIDTILSLSKENAFLFRLIMINPKLNDYLYPMPYLQYSKCNKVINPILDNGRILSADYVDIYLNELDLEVIASQYTKTHHIIKDCYVARKDYLPRWFTDYVYELFEAKTKLKGGDKVLYAMKKATLNSCYGMTVQKPVKDDIVENYETGEYSYADNSLDEYKEKYEKYCKSMNSILPFQWGCWVTSYAARNIFKLGACAKHWFYTDTDSAYAQGWDIEKVNEYNNQCKELLKANGYGAVIYNDREYWLGVAEPDSEYTEFIVQHSKCYAGRSKDDGELHITVAGVPKKAVTELKNNLNNFRPGFIFSGIASGKKTHTYQYVDKIYIDKNGNEIGDNIDLTPCDYKLNSINHVPELEEYLTETVEIQVFE